MEEKRRLQKNDDNSVLLTSITRTNGESIWGKKFRFYNSHQIPKLDPNGLNTKIYALKL